MSSPSNQQSTQQPSDEEVRRFVYDLDIDDPLDNKRYSWFCGKGAQSRNAQALLRLLVFLNPNALERVKCPKTKRNHKLSIVMGHDKPRLLGAFSEVWFKRERQNDCCRIDPKPLTQQEYEQLNQAFNLWKARVKVHEDQRRAARDAERLAVKAAKKAEQLAVKAAKKAEQLVAKRANKGKAKAQLSSGLLSPPLTSPARPDMLAVTADRHSKIVEALNQCFEVNAGSSNREPSTSIFSTPGKKPAAFPILSPLHSPKTPTTPASSSTSSFFSEAATFTPSKTSKKLTSFPSLSSLNSPTTPAMSPHSSISVIGGRLLTASFLAQNRTTATDNNYNAGSVVCNTNLPVCSVLSAPRAVEGSQKNNDPSDSIQAPNDICPSDIIEISSDDEETDLVYRTSRMVNSEGPIEISDDESELSSIPNNSTSTSTSGLSSSLIAFAGSHDSVIYISSDEEQESSYPGLGKRSRGGPKGGSNVVKKPRNN